MEFGGDKTLDNHKIAIYYTIYWSDCRSILHILILHSQKILNGIYHDYILFWQAWLHM